MEQQLKILCVDDEPNILSAFKRQLKDSFQLEVVTSGQQGLDLIGSGERYAVIVSDMRMPVMDGATFLKQASIISPDSVRIMLTGNLDQETATNAINTGNIYRFLNKPCSSEQLSEVLKEAIEQYLLITAEKDLLQNTLTGSIKVLTDILSLSDPEAFGSSVRLRQPAKEIATKLNYTNIWEIELAAMLSAIGWVTVPEVTKSAYRSNNTLTADQLELITKLPVISSNLIASIPRLSSVAKIIRYSEKNFAGASLPDEHITGDKIPEGSRIIKIAKYVAKLETQGMSRVQALEFMRKDTRQFDPRLIKVLLGGNEKLGYSEQVQNVSIAAKELCVGHRLRADLYCSDGRLLLTAGTYISELLLNSIKNYQANPGLKLPIIVDSRIPIVEEAKSAFKNNGAI